MDLHDLARALLHASDVGFGSVKIYSGDGHEYNVIVCKESEDEVLENLEVPYTSACSKKTETLIYPKIVLSIWTIL